MQTRQKGADKIIRKASRVIGRAQGNLDTLYSRRVTNKLNNNIQDDATHPLKQKLTVDCMIECSGRISVPRARTVRYSKSFVPRAVALFNRSARGGR